jgi:hypothetical protein
MHKPLCWVAHREILLLTRLAKAAEEYCEQIATDENETALLRGGFS